MIKEPISDKQHQADLERLGQLTIEMHPQDVKFTLKHDSKSDYKEVIHDAVGLLGGLQAYINNGHSLEGLPKEIRDTFGEIHVYRTIDRTESLE